MNPSELVSIALQDIIEIEVTGRLPLIPLLEEDIPELIPGEVRKIPLFIALILKNSEICRIRSPFSLMEEYLYRIIEDEKINEDYSLIHPHLFELSEILINNCYNIENKNEIRLLVEQIKELRRQKTINGLNNLDGDVLKPQNWTAWEFNEMKEFITKGMGLINSMRNE